MGTPHDRGGRARGACHKREAALCQQRIKLIDEFLSAVFDVRPSIRLMAPGLARQRDSEGRGSRHRPRRGEARDAAVRPRPVRRTRRSAMRGRRDRDAG